MMPNGFIIVVDRALDVMPNPILRRYRDAMVLGTYRENVLYAMGKVYQNPSFSHFYRRFVPGGYLPFFRPGPEWEANRYFAYAVDEFNAGRRASACVQLGRLSHLITDMACPVHAHSVIHETDPFEWIVDAMMDELLAIDVPPWPPCKRASDVVRGMALATRKFPVDGTHNGWGRLMKRMGIRHTIKRPELQEQARILVPLAAAYQAELFRLFSEQVSLEPDDPALPDDETTIQETLDGLEMPPDGLRIWFKRMCEFCDKHGGHNMYDGLMQTLESYMAVLGKAEPVLAGQEN
jgi:hypothetical protein